MNQEAVEVVMQTFVKSIGDFIDFANPSNEYKRREDDYKRKASEKAREILNPYVSGEKTLMSDQEANELAASIIKLTNFMNWRDLSAIDEHFDGEGCWLKFMTHILKILKSLSNGKWQEELGKLLTWLTDEIKLAANLTKIVPTYFLFLWDPTNHFFIKPQFTDRFLKLLQEKPTGTGVPLSVEMYERVRDVCHRFRNNIAQYHPRDNIDVHNVMFTVRADSGNETFPPNSPPEGGTDGEKKVKPPTLGQPHRFDMPMNIILAGPPGTGKTHNILHKYLPQFTETHKQPHQEFISETCGSLTWFESCILALLLKGGHAKVNEIAASETVLAKAVARNRTKNVKSTIWTELQEHTVQECPYVNMATYREPRVFWKEDDSSWRLIDGASEQFPELVELAEHIRNYKPEQTTTQRYDFVTFHQSYSYEDFVEGIKPTMSEESVDGGSASIQYEIIDGIFKRMVSRAMADPINNYALFIDEVNRGNVANIFGELITLIESDKRMTYDTDSQKWVGGVRVKLPYTHSSDPTSPAFGIPDNLHIIASMNTADRSIALMDYALRRRFAFTEIMPEPELLRITPGAVNCDDGSEILLDKMLDVMNQRIEYLYDRDHTLGHYYLMNVRTLEELVAVFRNQILPLLQEYFYGDWEKIQLVLGDLVNETDSDGRFKAHTNAIVTHLTVKPDKTIGVQCDIYQPRRLYTINDDISAASFIKIYNGQ